MTVACVRTVAFSGVEVVPVEVQVSLVAGLPKFNIVGLPDKAVGESRERIRAALSASGLAMPQRRVVVNLAPADVNKEGSHYDLPLAMALLGAMGAMDPDALDGVVALGELGLDGRISAVPGILPAAAYCRQRGLRLVCPFEQDTEADRIKGCGFLPAATLERVSAAFAKSPPSGFRVATGAARPGAEVAPGTHPDLSEVKGQDGARLALEVAAAGSHNLLLAGPPGSGKSLLARCLPPLLPGLAAEEELETMVIHSLAGKLPATGIVRERPFRAPHHTSSQAALAGGGADARPGEVSLAHRGVLFLDELPEFPRTALEAMREPMEAGKITISRATTRRTYPARFQMVGAMNLCRCGEYDPEKGIRCGKNQIDQASSLPRCVVEYAQRLSGPLMDRIDIRVDVRPLLPRDLVATEGGEPTAPVAARVAAARARQHERGASNAELEGAKLNEVAIPKDKDARSWMIMAADRAGISARGWTRALRVARTLADLEGAPAVTAEHLEIALHWRLEPGKERRAGEEVALGYLERLRAGPAPAPRAPRGKGKVKAAKAAPAPEEAAPAPPPARRRRRSNGEDGVAALIG